MACLHPIEAWQDLGQTTKNGGHPVFFSMPRPVADMTRALGRYDSKRYRAVSIPCGKCILCRKKRSTEILLRAVAESRLNPLSSHAFLTLTFDDAHLSDALVDGKIQHRPFQLFMKRLRKSLCGRKIRFLMCGEFGEKTHRPHYHAILFDCDLTDSYFDQDGFYHGSKLVEKSWHFGLCSVSSVNINRLAYVAGYTTKSSDPGFEPYVRWSRRPGLGSLYFDRYFSDIYKDGSSSTYCLNGDEFNFSIRYFDEKFRLRCPELFDNLKAVRRDRVDELQASVDPEDEIKRLENKAKLLEIKLARRSRDLL